MGDHFFFMKNFDCLWIKYVTLMVIDLCVQYQRNAPQDKVYSAASSVETGLIHKLNNVWLCGLYSKLYCCLFLRLFICVFSVRLVFLL